MTKVFWFLGGFLLVLAVLLLLALVALQRDGAVPLLQAVLQPGAAAPTPAPGAPAMPQPESTPPSNRHRMATAILRWARQGVSATACARLEIDGAWQVHYGPCDEGARVAPLTQDELDLLRYYLLRYQPFDYALKEQPGAPQEATITLALRGNGRLTAAPENLAEIARWAAQVHDRLSESERRDDLVARGRSHLAARLGLTIEEVHPLAIDVVRWPDACLGLHAAGQFCAQVVTPGFRVTLLAGDKVHEYRADIYGRLRATEGFAPPYLLPPLGD